MDTGGINHCVDAIVIFDKGVRLLASLDRIIAVVVAIVVLVVVGIMLLQHLSASSAQPVKQQRTAPSQFLGSRRWSWWRRCCSSQRVAVVVSSIVLVSIRVRIRIRIPLNRVRVRIYTHLATTTAHLVVSLFLCWFLRLIVCLYWFWSLCMCRFQLLRCFHRMIPE